MPYLLDYLLHFFGSNSRHGTHSPFVYSLAEQAIYKKTFVEQISFPENFSPSYKPLLTRVLNHLEVEELVNSASSLERRQAFLINSITSNDCDLRALLKDYTVIIVDGIYKNPSLKQWWKNAIKNPEVVVSIDLFHFGLLFHRIGQEKEHFQLRYPFWTI